MYEHVWTCMNMYEHVWTRMSMNMYEHVWTRISMNMYEHVWTCMNTYEHVWACMNMYEHVWTRMSMNMYEHVWAWTCMSMYEHVWACMNTYEHVWTRMNMYLIACMNSWTRMNICDTREHVCARMSIYEHVWTWARLCMCNMHDTTINTMLLRAKSTQRLPMHRMITDWTCVWNCARLILHEDVILRKFAPVLDAPCHNSFSTHVWPYYTIKWIHNVYSVSTLH